THQGVFDVAFLSEIPNVKIYSPEGYVELEQCLQKAVLVDTGVCVVRYPRGADCKTHNMNISTDFSYKDNNSNAILVSYGRIFSNCYDAAEIESKNGKAISLLKMTQISPINEKIVNILLKYNNIFFVEEGIKNGSIAQQMAAILLEKGYNGKMKIVAIEDKFVDQGTVLQILSELKMDTQSIAKMIDDNC
ncbi:MAG: transketolase C-terminal domain-containing protein, partial [Oscillospiraceae bacterium]